MLIECAVAYMYVRAFLFGLAVLLALFILCLEGIGALLVVIKRLKRESCGGWIERFEELLGPQPGREYTWSVPLHPAGAAQRFRLKRPLTFVWPVAGAVFTLTVDGGSVSLLSRRMRASPLS